MYKGRTDVGISDNAFSKSLHSCLPYQDQTLSKGEAEAEL